MNDGSVNSESNSKVSINESNTNDGSNSDHNIHQNSMKLHKQGSQHFK
jgi:hypothetical protein